MTKISIELHPSQRDVYVDQLINKSSPHYNIGGYLKLNGHLDKEKFQDAVSSAAKVFDAFKMRFDLEAADSKCYKDEDHDELQLSELDFSSTANPSESALSWMQNRFNTPFIIKKENLLFEHSIIKISDDEHWFFGRYHHLITDGYGFIVFVQYIAQKYRSLLSNDKQDFIYPSYLNEIEKASEYTKSSKYTADRQYWDDKIDKLSGKIFQRKYYSNNSLKTTSSYVLEMDNEQRSRLDEIQLVTKSGLQQLTIAALLIYFGKTSDQTEFVFGIPVHKRSSKVLRSMVGMFSGILPFKAAFKSECTLSDLLKEITQIQKSDYRHQNYPMGDIGKNLSERSSEDYLYEISINYELLNFELDFGEDIDAEIIRLESESERNPLQFFWRDYGNRQPLQFIMKFGDEYYSKKEAELFAKRILIIIEQFPDALDKSIGNINILPEEERLLIENFNNTSFEYSFEKNIVKLFEVQTIHSPDNIALVFENQQLTYKELNEKSNRLAHYLITKGVTEETLVPIVIERSFEMIIGILGILKAGGAYVPIDPQYPEERITYMLEDSGAKIILSSKKSSVKIPVSKKYEIIKLDEDESSFSKMSSANPPTSISPKQLAYIIYTSGSTGKPKGVMVEHGTVANLINTQSRYFNIKRDEGILLFANYCFDASVEQMFLALCNGASLILFPEGLQLNAELFENFLNEKKVSHLHATPSFLENINLTDNEYLKRVIAGGEVCKKELEEKWKNKTAFYNEYGPTECTVTAIEYLDNINIEKNISLPIGKPLANIQTYILNKFNELCPIGEAGELCIAGDCLARGYLNLPELTAEKFVKNPFSKNPESLMYRTGDICRMFADGNIEYIGRRDEQVKIRGYRIELGEIESALQESGLVNKSVVTGRDNRLIAYVVPDGIFDRDTIQNFLKKKLPEYMIPAVFVEMESLPLMSTGKIDRNALPEPDAGELLSSEYKAPDSEMETLLTEIWKELFNTNKIGVNDNFFELGGQSLNAIQLSSRLNKLLNIKTDIGTIFSNPTIRKLSRALALEKKTQFTEIVRQTGKEYYELSHSQKRFWILSNFKHGSEAYNVSNVFEIEGELNVEAFKRAFDTVIERHEILRTVFADIDGEPKQKILSSKESGFKIIEKDLRNNKNAEQIIKKWIEDDALMPFDLKNGPLIRAVLFRDEEKFILVFNIHHIISDGWSKGIFIKEILHLYELYSKGDENDLTPPPLQYKDYAAWHNDSFDMQRKYWKELYENDIPVLSFPPDFERPKVLSYFGEMLQKTVPESLTSSLRQLAVKNNMSLNNLLLALYGLIVAGHSHQEDVVIGSVSSGRSHPDFENLIGAFINFLPIRLLPKRYLKLSEYLGNSRDTIIQSYNNQDFPFDLMVDEFIKKRDISRNPFFDTMINFQLDDDLKGKVISIKPLQSMQENLFQSVLDFKLDVMSSDGMMNLYLSYNSKLFSKKRMADFLDEFIQLLSNVGKDRDNYLSEYVGGKAEKNNQATDEAVTEPEAPLIPVNICSSFVIEPVQEYMEYWSREFDLNLKISFAPYNQVFQQLISPDSLLYGNKGINILFVRPEDWLRDQKGLSSSEQTDHLELTYSEFKMAITILREKTFIPFLAGIVPVYSGSNVEKEVDDFINNLIKDLEIFLKSQPSFQIIDFDKIASLYDITEIYNAKSDEIGHMPFTPEYYAALGTYLTRKVRAFTNPGYKVIAMDCDNTLWKGICGETGALNVDIDENFIELQEFFIEKYNEGFLLVLCSKNNEDDVWEVFDKHPEMKLKREHIAAHRINWQPKPENLLSISKELNLGMNSIIFIDDSGFETEQMSLNCPDVLSLTLPEDPGSFTGFLNHIWEFDNFRITDEDRKRNQMYKVEKQRMEEQVRYGSLSDFLESLNIEVNIRAMDEKDIDRAVQLSLRTNQFNLNGIRKTPEDIAGAVSQKGSVNWIIEVKDRFGDYGITGLVLAKERQNVLLIESFLLSCRVLGRNVETIIFSELQKYCAAHGLDTISALYQPTPKNKPFQEFLSNSEWTQDSQTNEHSHFLKTAEQTIA